MTNSGPQSGWSVERLTRRWRPRISKWTSMVLRLTDIPVHPKAERARLV